MEDRAASMTEATRPGGSRSHPTIAEKVSSGGCSTGSYGRGASSSEALILSVENIDTMLSGSKVIQERSRGRGRKKEDGPSIGEALSKAPGMGSPTIQYPTPKSLFSTFMLSPSYHTKCVDPRGTGQCDPSVLVKVNTPRGEPFYLLDCSGQHAMSSLACTERVHLVPYQPEAACEDECRGQPMLHLASNEMMAELFNTAITELGVSNWFYGLAMVSGVSIQVYNAPPANKGTKSYAYTVGCSRTFRVAADSDGQIETREAQVEGGCGRGCPTVAFCDYPSPFVIADYSVFAEGGPRAAAIVEAMTKVNVSLIDTLSKIQYQQLHKAEDSMIDAFAETLRGFMERHSYSVKYLLQQQLRGERCDDPFERRQRKSEVDTLVRLMMRESEIIGVMDRAIAGMMHIQQAISSAAPMASDAVDKIIAEEEAEEAASCAAASKDDCVDKTAEEPRRSRRCGSEDEADPAVEDASTIEAEGNSERAFPVAACRACQPSPEKDPFGESDIVAIVESEVEDTPRRRSRRA